MSNESNTNLPYKLRVSVLWVRVKIYPFGSTWYSSLLSYEVVH